MVTAHHIDTGKNDKPFQAGGTWWNPIAEEVDNNDCFSLVLFFLV